MLTPHTHAIFARDRAAIEAARHYTPAQREIFRASTAERHAEYERHHEATVAALGKLSARAMASACRYLERLGRAGCRSGTMEYRETCDALERLGVPGANRVFEHDRAALAARFGEGRKAA